MVDLLVSLLASVASAVHTTCKIKGQIMDISLLVCAVLWIHANIFTCVDMVQLNYGAEDGEPELQFLTPES